MDESSGIWDVPGANFGSDLSPTRRNFMRNSLYGSVLPQALRRTPYGPPLPPRPRNMQGTYNGPGPFYNNFNYGGYPNYSGTGYGYGYGYRAGFPNFGYGYNQNGYYNPNNPESRFIQLAEESSRPAFQAIQSVLQSFSSVAMMFDSTFHALYSSYMSVISVADNFGKLRSNFGRVFSLLAVFRALHWLYRKLLYMLGISKINPEAERLWVNALKSVSGSSESTQKPWSTMLFLSLIMAGPYLLFKLMSHIYPNPIKDIWNPVEHPGTTAVGVYDFQSSNEQELSFPANQKLMIAPDKFQPTNCPGWLLACDRTQKIGLVPKNYIGLMMRSEITGKPYIEHNGQNYDISNCFRTKKRKSSEESEKTSPGSIEDSDKEIESSSEQD